MSRRKGSNALRWRCLAVVLLAAGAGLACAGAEESGSAAREIHERKTRLNLFRGDVASLGSKMILFSSDLPLPETSDPAEIRFLESLREGFAESIRFTQSLVLMAELGASHPDGAEAGEKLKLWIWDGRRMIESRRRTLDRLAREVSARSELAEKLTEFKSLLDELESSAARLGG